MNISLISGIIAIIPWLIIFFHAFFRYKPKEKDMRRHLLFAFGSVSLGLFCGVLGHIYGNQFSFKFFDSFVVFSIFWFFCFLLDIIPQSKEKLLVKICGIHLFLTWLIILFTHPEINYQDIGIIYVRSQATALAVLLFSFCWWVFIVYWFFKASYFLKDKKAKRSFQWMGVAGIFALLALFLAMIKTFFPQVTISFHIMAISSTGFCGIIFYLGARISYTFQIMEEKGHLLKLREIHLSPKEIKEKLRLFTTSFEQSVEGMAIADIEGNIVFVNKSWLDAHGLTETEVIGKNFSIFHTKEQLENEVIPFNKKLIEKGQEKGEIGHLKKNSATFPAFMTSTVIKNEKGKPLALLGTMIDITERKQAEEKIKMTIEELKAVNKEMESFTHIVSHDLKEPLAGIEGLCQFLLKEDYSDKLDDEMKKDFLKQISIGVVRMRNLIDDLLILSQISRVKNPYQSVDSKKFIDEVIERLKQTIEERNVKIEIDEKLPFIYCDPIKIKEVFYNFISNAIKYNDKSEPKIEIGINDNIFFIRDNGIGIKRVYYELVFQIFKRLHGNTEYGGGTGIGLAIVKNIIEEHNGKIWIESEEGKGSTFFFTINTIGDYKTKGKG